MQQRQVSLATMVLAAALCNLSANAQDAATTAADRFQDLYQTEWEFRLQEQPQLATWTGDSRFNNRLARKTPADIQRRHEYWQGVLEKLAAINPALLSAEDQINYAIFERQIRSFVDSVDNLAYLMPFNSDSGFYSSLARLPQSTPFETQADYNNYLDRLAMVPQVIDDNIGLMQEGLRLGMTQPAVVLKGRDKAIIAHIVDGADDSVFFQPLLEPSAALSDNARIQIQARGRQLVEQGIIPAYRRLLSFFNGAYAEGARQSIGAHELPNGERYYADQVRYYTTLELSPREIHDIGLAEVARIRASMEKIIAELAFEGSFDDFLEYLRSDPSFYAKSPRELLMVASYYAKKMDGALPRYFKRLPRQPYGVEPVPEDLAPFYTSGRYAGAPLDSMRPGLYWVNTYNLPSRPLYAIPALTLHEAVPGHHLQGALAKELGEQPPFRRHDYISAFGEGWGLYAEYLGVEAGIYETPQDHFGRLTYEMWRACRLVVDTGMHAFGWSRERALDYLANNTALSMHEVTTEIDRYISWPGQALSYKLGELKIKQLRERAETQLGERFDLRDFHDVLLAQGSVPLDVLEQAVTRYIEELQQ